MLLDQEWRKWRIGRNIRTSKTNSRFNFRKKYFTALILNICKQQFQVIFYWIMHSDWFVLNWTTPNAEKSWTFENRMPSDGCDIVCKEETPMFTVSSLKNKIQSKISLFLIYSDRPLFFLHIITDSHFLWLHCRSYYRFSLNGTKGHVPVPQSLQRRRACTCTCTYRVDVPFYKEKTDRRAPLLFPSRIIPTRPTHAKPITANITVQSSVSQSPESPERGSGAKSIQTALRGWLTPTQRGRHAQSFEPRLTPPATVHRPEQTAHACTYTYMYTVLKPPKKSQQLPVISG